MRISPLHDILVSATHQKLLDLQKSLLLVNDDMCVCAFAVNSVCWGPYDFGLILACGSSDGAISLLTFTGDQQWDVKKISNAHTVSVTHRSRVLPRCCSVC